jgi:hypothetical protein
MDWQIVFSGTGSQDLNTRLDVHLSPTTSGVSYTNAMTGTCIDIATQGRPGRGAKITAQQPIDPQRFDGFVAAASFGGGALNQAERLVKCLPPSHQDAGVVVIDSSAPCPALAAHCFSFGMEIVPLDCHDLPVNVVSPYEGDKLIVRSPVKPQGWLDAYQRSRLREAARSAAVIVCVSPKDGLLAQELFRAAAQAVGYIQPTGGLPAELTLQLARGCRGLACNAHELGLLAGGLDIGAPEIDEASPTAADDAAQLLIQLHEQRNLGCAVAAITLGRRGGVVVEWPERRAWAIEIQVPGGVAATPSKAGDHWNAAWIVEREINRLAEPFAAEAATRTVASAIVPDPAAVQIRVREIHLPLLRSHRVRQPHIRRPAAQRRPLAS